MFVQSGRHSKRRPFFLIAAAVVCVFSSSLLQHFFYQYLWRMLQIHPFRLKPGEDLKAGIEAYVQQHQLKAAFVLTCVGSLTQYHLRMADQPKGEKKNGHFEIVSLVGTCSIHGSHVHLSISNETGTTIGGHLLEECYVYTTAEIVLGESTEHVFVRENDGSTAWEELQVKKRQ